MEKKDTFLKEDIQELRQVEERLFQAAEQLPEPQKGVPILCEKQSVKDSAVRTGTLGRHFRFLWKNPAVRAALITMAIVLAGTTTAFAAIPEFRQSVIRFFTSGLVEEVPEIVPGTEEIWTKETVSGEESTAANGNTQTVGHLTMTQEYSLDKHFTAMYFASEHDLNIAYAASGEAIFSTREPGKDPMYYVLEDGVLKQAESEQHSLTVTVMPEGPLPGMMDHDGWGLKYDTLRYEPQQMTVFWQQIGGGLMPEEYPDVDFCVFRGEDGLEAETRIYCTAVAGSTEYLQLNFIIDGQRTD